MNSTWVAAFVAAALVGAVVTPRLTAYGLGKLARGHATRPCLRIATAIAGGGAGVVAIMTSQRAHTWWLAPALLVWACALVAAASCDAVTQRIPTALVRQAGVGTGVLLTVGATAHGDWRGLLLSGIAAVAAGSVLLQCWRFAGAGLGDVRLAVLGGLGLGHATQLGLVVGLAVFTLLTLVQAGVTLARTGDRHATFPYGPGLAIGFLLAASL